jgi:hypothetical protein
VHPSFLASRTAARSTVETASHRQVHDLLFVDSDMADLPRLLVTSPAGKNALPA